MAGEGKLLSGLRGVAAIYLLGSAVAHGQDLYGCVRPAGMPPVPDGSTATLADMQATREAVEEFLSDGESYVSCLADVPEDPTVSAIRNQFVAQMDLVVDRFNFALCAYSRGLQCVRPVLEDPSVTVPFEGQPTASVSDTRASRTYESYQVQDEFSQADADAAAGSDLDNSGDAVVFGSEQASAQEPIWAEAGGQIKEPSLAEPTLPDGTPCGSLTQIRNDVSGEGSSLRGHYIWDVYNACFEPIRVRWTFAGDGVLNAQRAIPARGAQRIGCSTRGGTVSSRYCTGGVEYAFEWPGAERPF